MKLSVLERITLLGMLPKEGSFVTMKLLIDLKAKLAFSEKDIKDFKIEENEGRITWRMSVDKDIEIGERMTETIVASLKKIDEEGKINEQNITLFEKFITNG